MEAGGRAKEWRVHDASGPMNDVGLIDQAPGRSSSAVNSTVTRRYESKVVLLGSTGISADVSVMLPSAMSCRITRSGVPISAPLPCFPAQRVAFTIATLRAWLPFET